MRSLLLTIALLGLATASSAEAPRQIALTFDDAPRGDGVFMNGRQRTKALIDALRNAEVDGAMFFVTTGNLARQGEAGDIRLQAYAEAGHYLANHSHRHPWLHRSDVDDYVADLDFASEELSRFSNVEDFFRFPFLDEGRETGKRDAIRQALAERGIRNGYVTVDNYDWYIDMLAVESSRYDSLDMEELRDLYVTVLVDAVEHYDRIAQDVLGRSPRHVLLLHENDLAALFVGDLVAGLRENGWEIIPALNAFEDPIADEEPDTLFLGQGRIAALAHIAGYEPRDLVHKSEDEEQLRAAFVESGLLPAPLDESNNETNDQELQ